MARATTNPWEYIYFLLSVNTRGQSNASLTPEFFMAGFCEIRWGHYGSTNTQTQGHLAYLGEDTSITPCRQLILLPCPRSILVDKRIIHLCQHTLCRIFTGIHWDTTDRYAQTQIIRLTLRRTRQLLRTAD